jgi:hypothetical protein
MSNVTGLNGGLGHLFASGNGFGNSKNALQTKSGGIAVSNFIKES